MKTKIAIYLIIFTGILSTCFAKQNSEKLITEIRPADRFIGVELRNEANVFIRLGDTQEIKIEGTESDIRHITTKVKNNELVIGTEKDYKLGENVNVYITVMELCRMELNGSGRIQTTDLIKCPNMIIQVSGSGEVNASLNSKLAKIDLSGSGNIILRGKVNETNLNITGSGEISGRELKTFSCEVNITGSGSTTINVTNDLKAEITGSGNIYYLNKPELIRGKITGSGRVLLIS